MLEIHTDITADVIGINRLEENVQKSRALSTATLEGIVLTRNGVIFDANKSAQSILNSPTSELIGQSFSHFLSARDRLVYNEDLTKTGTSRFYTSLCRQGEAKLPVEIYCKPLSTNEPTLYVTAIRDRSLEIELENKEREQQDILIDAFSEAPIGIAILDANGLFHYWNRAFEKLTEYSSNRLKKLGFSDLIPGNELNKYLSYSRKLSDQAWKKAKLNTVLVTRNDEHLHIRIQAVRIGTTQKPLFVFFIIDVTAQVTMENKQRQLAEKLRQIHRDMEEYTGIIRKEAEFIQELPDYGLPELDNSIVAYILRGLTNREIAERVHLAEITVKKHVSSIYKAFNVNKRSALIDLLNEN